MTQFSLKPSLGRLKSVVQREQPVVHKRRKTRRGLEQSPLAEVVKLDSLVLMLKLNYCESAPFDLLKEVGRLPHRVHTVVFAASSQT